MKSITTKQKFLILSLMTAIGLSACNKPSNENQTAESTTKVETTATDSTQSTDATSTNTTDEKAGDELHHESDDHAAHAHDEHAGHDHSQDDDAYQCSDNKTVFIAIDNHEGEMEALFNYDDIGYEMNQDPANANRYTTDDGIQGDNKGMTLIIDGDKAKVVGSDNAVLLDCTKKS